MHIHIYSGRIGFFFFFLEGGVYMVYSESFDSFGDFGAFIANHLI